jgi:hypothetical protein
VLLLFAMRLLKFFFLKKAVRFLNPLLFHAVERHGTTEKRTSITPRGAARYSTEYTSFSSYKLAHNPLHQAQRIHTRFLTQKD